MRALRTTVAAAGLAASLLFSQDDANAQQVAVAGRTPASAVAVLSIPDTAAFWNQFAQSSFYGSVQQVLGAPLADANLAQQLKAARARLEPNLGFGLDPQDIFTNVLTGLDIYAVEVSDTPTPGKGWLVSAKFADGSQAKKVLDQLLSDARLAEGIVGGVAVNTVLERKVGSATLFAMPGFSLFVSQNGNVLSLSSSETAMAESLRAGSESRLLSYDYKEMFAPLEGTAHQLWYFGDSTALATMAGLPTQGASLPKRPFGGMIALEKGTVTHTAYRPSGTFTGVERAFAAKAAQTAGFGVTDFLPHDSIVAYATNCVDMKGLLAGIEEDVRAYGMAEANPIDAALAGNPQADEVLAMFGNEFGFSLGSLSMKANPGPGELPIDIEFMMVANASDNKLRNSFRSGIESAFQQSGLPMKLDWSSYMDAELVSLDLKSATQGMVSLEPGMGVTTDGFLLFGVAIRDLRLAIDRAKAQGPSSVTAALKADPRMKKAFDAADTIATADLPRLVRAFGSFLRMAESTPGATDQFGGAQGLAKAKRLLANAELLANNKLLLSVGAFDRNGMMSKTYIVDNGK